MPRAGSLGQRARGCCCVYTQQTELRHPPAAWRPAVPSSRPVLHTVPCFLEGQLEGCHAMGHPADQIPPSLGAPAVRSHCVRMDGGMGGVKVKTQTKSRPCAKFPAASKFFWNRAGGGGEHGPATTNGVTYHGSSPRGRGTLVDVRPKAFIGRVIPAWAGNTTREARCRYPPTGHPRVGGEHGPATTNGVTYHGSLGGEHSNCKQLIWHRRKPRGGRLP